MSDLDEAKDLLDLMDKWLVPPIVAENEQLKARVIALEAEVARLTAEQSRSSPAKEKSLATFGPPDAGYYREETP